MVHEKAQGIAVLAAAKAVKKLFGRTDRETGGFLAMKWAQAHEVGATLLELHKAAYNFQIAVQWMGEMTEEQIRQELDLIIENNQQRNKACC